jgi:hypothetical protein
VKIGLDFDPTRNVGGDRIYHAALTLSLSPKLKH